MQINVADNIFLNPAPSVVQPYTAGITMQIIMVNFFQSHTNL